MAARLVGSYFPDQGSNLAVKAASPNRWTTREFPGYFFLPLYTDLRSPLISPLSHSRPPSQTSIAFSNMSIPYSTGGCQLSPWPPATVTGQGKSVPYLLDLLFYGKCFSLTCYQVF